MYEFPVKKCEQCGKTLKADENIAIEEDEKVKGYCPNCLVGYEMVEKK